MPNNELNSIRIAVKNGETNESNPVNIVTVAENVEVKTDSFQGNILDYIEDLAENIHKKFEEQPQEKEEIKIIIPNNNNIIDKNMQKRNVERIDDDGRKYDEDYGSYNYYTYGVKDSIESGIIPAIISQEKRLNTLSDGDSSGAISENNLLSFLNDNFVDNISFDTGDDIFYKFLKNNDDSFEIGLNINFKPGIVWDDRLDVNKLYENIREIIYCEIPFNVYYKFVPGSVRRINNNTGSISLYAKLKLVHRDGITREYGGKRYITPIKMILTQNNEYEYIRDYAIRSGNNVMISFGSEGNVRTKFLRYDVMTDFDYATLTMPMYKSIPILMGVEKNSFKKYVNRNEMVDKVNWYNYAKFERDVTETFINQLNETLALVENVKNDNTGKYVLKISNSIRYDIGDNFNIEDSRGNITDPANNFGEYTLYTPVFLDIKKAYVQINDGPMSELLIFSEGDIYKERRYDPTKCYLKAKLSNIHNPLGNFVEWGLSPMQVCGYGYPNGYPKTKYAVSPKNKITIYITEFELGVDWTTDHESIPL